MQVILDITNNFQTAQPIFVFVQVILDAAAESPTPIEAPPTTPAKKRKLSGEEKTTKRLKVEPPPAPRKRQPARRAAQPKPLPDWMQACRLLEKSQRSWDYHCVENPYIILLLFSYHISV